MAKFLNTSGTNYHLEELIKGARDRLILISPFLKMNDRIKELLEDKNRMKLDVRIVYGKSDELLPSEVEWLKRLEFVRTSFCKNLHAKAYLSEEVCIVTSMNLYDFSMVNNNEMGILIRRSEDADLYRETYDEVQRLIRVSDEVRLSIERVEPKKEEEQPSTNGFDKLTTGKLAMQLGVTSKELFDRLTAAGFLEPRDNRLYITAKGRQAGGEWRTGTHGGYFLWPKEMQLSGK